MFAVVMTKKDGKNVAAPDIFNAMEVPFVIGRVQETGLKRSIISG